MIVNNKTYYYKMSTISLYYSNKCQHCISFKPVWNELKNKIAGSIAVKEYEDIADFEIINNSNIEYYPTLRIKKKNKQEYDYIGAMNVKDILNELDEYNMYETKYHKYKTKYFNKK